MSFNIGDYLKRFVGLTPPDDFIKEEVLKIVKDKIGIDLNKKEITISNGVIYIKTTPIIKNEIFINREKILQNLKQTLGIKSPKDIK